MADLGQLEAEKNSKRKVYNFPVIFLLCFAGIFVIGGIVLTIIIFFDPIYGKPMVLGETIGGTAGSIWALAGVFLFFGALMLQANELKLQRESFSQSVVAQKESAKALQTQARQNIIRAEIDVNIAILNAQIAMEEITTQARINANTVIRKLNKLVKDLKGESSK